MAMPGDDFRRRLVPTAQREPARFGATCVAEQGREVLLGRLGALSSEMQATSYRLLASCSLPLSQLPVTAARRPLQLAERGAQLRRAAATALTAAATARDLEAVTAEAARMRLDTDVARRAAATAEARSAALTEEADRLREVIKVISGSLTAMSDRCGGIHLHRPMLSPTVPNSPSFDAKKASREMLRSET